MGTVGTVGTVSTGGGAAMQIDLLGAENKQAFLHRTPANRLKIPLGNALTKQACWAQKTNKPFCIVPRPIGRKHLGGMPSPNRPAGKMGGLGGRKLRWNNAIVIHPCGPPAGNNLSCLSAEKREDNSKNFPQIRRSRLPAQAGTPPPVAPGAGRVVQGGRRKRLPAKTNAQLPPPKPAPPQVLAFRPGNKQAPQGRINSLNSSTETLRP